MNEIDKILRKTGRILKNKKQYLKEVRVKLICKDKKDVEGNGEWYI